MIQRDRATGWQKLVDSKNAFADSSINVPPPVTPASKGLFWTVSLRFQVMPVDSRGAKSADAEVMPRLAGFRFSSWINGSSDEAVCSGAT